MFSKLSIMATLPLALALVAGALVPLQATSNSALARELGHPLWAALASLLVSLLTVSLVLAIIRAPLPSLVGAWQGPWWLWIGGIAGVVYVGAAAFLPPKLGAANFILWVVVGQVSMAMVIDHFGLMGIEARPVNWLRVTGVAVMLAGMALVQVSVSKNQRSAGSPTAERAHQAPR